MNGVEAIGLQLGCRLSAEPGVTAVVWSMHGPANLRTKVMHTLMNMDKMVGPSFEQGLAKLKGLAEG